MKRIWLRFSGLALILALILAVMITSPVLAAPGLSVDGVLLNVTLSPGQSYTHTMTVTSGADYPMDMQVEARGFGQSLDGSTIALLPQEDTSPNSARPFITDIDTSSFHLEPGGSQQVKATVVIPASIAPGTKYAIIYVSSQPGGSSGIGVIVAANVLVTIHVPGAELVKTGEISNLNAPDSESGKPVQALTTFKNTGNIHFKVKNQVIINNEAGEIVSQAETPLSSSSVIPGYSRLFTTTLNGLSVGRYVVESRIILEDGTRLDTEKSGLNVVEAENIQTSTEPVGEVAGISGQPTSGESSSSSGSFLGRPAKGISWSLAGIVIASIIAVGGIITAYLMTRRKSALPGNNDSTE